MKLRIRITLLLILAAVLPMFAVYVSLSLYSESQKRSLVDMKLTGVYGAAVNLYERKGSAVLQQMRQLSDDPILTRLLLVKDRNGYIDQQGLIKFASETRSLLNLDYLIVVNPVGEVLARGHDPGMFGDNINPNPVLAEALAGQKIQSLDKILLEGETTLISVAAVPVWYRDGQLIGVIAGGVYLDDEFCRDIRIMSGAEILLVEDDNLLAKTLPGKTDQLLMYLEYQKYYKADVEGLDYSFSRYPLYNLFGEKIADLMMGVSTQDLDILFKRMKLIFGGFALGGLLLAIIFGYIFAARFTKPIFKLTNAADRLADGDFSARVDYASRGELQNLIDTFNSMSEELENYRQKLIETERLSAFTLMARKVAHEIKNPLTPIKIAVQDLRRSFSSDDPKFGDDFERSTLTVLEEVQSLTNIVEEFSEFAKFPAPKPEPSEINEIVKLAVSIYDREREDGKLVVELSKTPIPVNADKEQIKRALINLVKNALEATALNGHVNISTSITSKIGRITISDNGPGFSPGAKENLFTPYFTTKPGGSGLGLVIVKKIIGEHGGSIKIADSVRGGTVAVVELSIRSNR